MSLQGIENAGLCERVQRRCRDCAVALGASGDVVLEVCN